MVAVALFAVIGGCTVAVPVAACLLVKDRMRAPLDGLRGWLELNSTPVVSVLLLAIDLLLFAQGAAGVKA